MIELAGSAAHVLVDDLVVLALSDPDAHHLDRVLRLRAGERVTATDGRGAWRWCRWNGTGVEPDGEIGLVARPEPEVGVAFAVLKGDRLDLIVQKLTEIGVDRLIPVTAERCVVRWDPTKAQAQVERLRRIVREAAMQSRRVFLPVVEPLTALDALLDRPGVSRADFGGDDVEVGAPGTATVIAVGPEGGWSATERESPGPVVSLGDTVLRAETAAISAGVLLVDRRRRAGHISD